MPSQAKTVDQYLAALPEDRQLALQAVRNVILKNLDKDYQEGIQYGMIGYYVPHRVYPAGYHCDPKQPLPFVGLGSQKNYMSLYLMCVYGSEKQRKWLAAEWAKAGKKLDMGKACLRFKKLDDLALDVIGQLIARVPAKTYIANYEAALGDRLPAKKARRQKPVKKVAGTKPAKRKVTSARKRSTKPTRR